MSGGDVAVLDLETACGCAHTVGQRTDQPGATVVVVVVAAACPAQPAVLKEVKVCLYNSVVSKV
jgi:hypothetical protein